MTTPARGANGPELRIGDRDREAALTALGEHYVAGRLTKEEYDERADVALTARTASALWPLFADLPRPTGTRPGPAPTGSTVVPVRSRPVWSIGTRMVPLLVLLVAIALVLRLPVFLLLVVWLIWARTHRQPGHSGAHHHGHRRW